MFLKNWKTMVAILVLIGIGSWFSYEGVVNVWDEYELMHKGKTTSGFIIDTWEDVEEADSGVDVWYHGVI